VCAARRRRPGPTAASRSTPFGSDPGPRASIRRAQKQAEQRRKKINNLADVCRELQVSEQTYYRWRNQFGGLKSDDAKRLKDPKRENATLKRLLADAELEKAAL
jgi:transposase-like protein